jgi:hypothetical protein
VELPRASFSLPVELFVSSSRSFSGKHRNVNKNIRANTTEQLASTKLRTHTATRRAQKISASSEEKKKRFEFARGCAQKVKKKSFFSFRSSSVRDRRSDKEFK